VNPELLTTVRKDTPTLRSICSGRKRKRGGKGKNRHQSPRSKMNCVRARGRGESWQRGSKRKRPRQFNSEKGSLGRSMTQERSPLEERMRGRVLMNESRTGIFGGTYGRKHIDSQHGKKRGMGVGRSKKVQSPVRDSNETENSKSRDQKENEAKKAQRASMSSPIPGKGFGGKREEVGEPTGLSKGGGQSSMKVRSQGGRVENRKAGERSLTCMRSTFGGKRRVCTPEVRSSGVTRVRTA